MSRSATTSINTLTLAFSVFLSVSLAPMIASAQSVPATGYCSSYQGISGLSGAAVSAQGEDCELKVESKNKTLSVRVQMSDFTADPAGAEAKYAAYERGAGVFTVACDGADHPCDLKTQESGSLITNIVTYSIPDEDDGSIFFNWGAGELVSAVDQYRGHVYSVFVMQGDSDGKVDNSGIHTAVIAKTKEIIDARATEDPDATSSEAADTSNGKKATSKDNTEDKGEDSADETEEENTKTLKVLAISEGVEIRREGGGWEDATASMRLEDGDEISTGPDSTITLQFPDGTIMQVSELTEVRVGFLLSEGNAVRAALQLKIGKVAAKVNPKKTSFTDFTIKSPIATASVRGTTFGAIYHSNTGMRVMVAEGSVEVTANDGTSQTVNAGYDVRVQEDGFGEQYPFDGVLFEGEAAALVAESEAGGTGTNGTGGLNTILLILFGVLVAGVALFILMRRR